METNAEDDAPARLALVERPVQLATALPKELKMDAAPLANWTDDELVRAIDLMERYLATAATRDDVS